MLSEATGGAGGGVQASAALRARRLAGGVLRAGGASTTVDGARGEGAGAGRKGTFTERAGSRHVIIQGAGAPSSSQQQQTASAAGAQQQSWSARAGDAKLIPLTKRTSRLRRYVRHVVTIFALAIIPTSARRVVDLRHAGMVRREISRDEPGTDSCSSRCRSSR